LIKIKPKNLSKKQKNFGKKRIKKNKKVKEK